MAKTETNEGDGGCVVLIIVAILVICVLGWFGGVRSDLQAIRESTQLIQADMRSLEIQMKRGTR